MNKKKIIIILSSVFLVALVEVLLFVFKKDTKKEDNSVVVLDIEDKTGKSYKNEIVVDANNTMEMDITISNKHESEIYNYGLYYTYFDNENHGIVIGQVADLKDIKTEGSISTDKIVIPIKITNISNQTKKIV